MNLNWISQLDGRYVKIKGAFQLAPNTSWPKWKPKSFYITRTEIKSANMNGKNFYGIRSFFLIVVTGRIILLSNRKNNSLLLVPWEVCNLICNRRQTWHMTIKTDEFMMIRNCTDLFQYRKYIPYLQGMKPLSWILKKKHNPVSFMTFPYIFWYVLIISLDWQNLNGFIWNRKKIILVMKIYWVYQEF